MENSELLNLEPINIKSIPNMNEQWIQDYIASNPNVIGLGDLEFKTKEKIQPNAGRLDLLLQDSENNLRYEVELQLGKTDESHIIRTIEYWDIEQKRYPQYDHCAVLIAEDITSRFLNIVQLFNGHIPLIAIQMKAYKINGKFAIIFTKIFDRIKYSYDDDEENDIIVDKNYWENRSSKENIEIVSELCNIMNEIEQGITLKFLKKSIQISKNGSSYKFIKMFPKKSFLRILLFMKKDEDIDKIFDDEIEEYNKGRYKMQLIKNEFFNKNNEIKTLLEKAYNEYKK